MSKYGVFTGPCFPVFGLNTEIYGVNLRIQSEYRKIRTRKNSVFGHFSRSVTFSDYLSQVVTQNGILGFSIIRRLKFIELASFLCYMNFSEVSIWKIQKNIKNTKAQKHGYYLLTENPFKRKKWKVKFINDNNKCKRFHWFPLDAGHKLNVHKMFRRSPGRLVNIF